MATHEAVGVGVYSFFRDGPCAVPAAIRAPPHASAAARDPRGGLEGVRFPGAFSKHLTGHGAILSVLNGKGPSSI